MFMKKPLYLSLSPYQNRNSIIHHRPHHLWYSPFCEYLEVEASGLLTCNLWGEGWVSHKRVQCFWRCAGLGCRVTVPKLKINVAESVIANTDVYSIKKVLEGNLAGARQRDVYIKTYAELLNFSYQQNQTKSLRSQLRTLLVQLVRASEITVAFSTKCWDFFLLGLRASVQNVLKVGY